MAEILVIEDDADIAHMVKEVLELDGHTVQVLSSGREALALVKGGRTSARRSRPQLIVTDVLLPGMDGYSLTKTLEKSSRMRDVPVIVVTAREDLRDVFLSAANVVDFIGKPFLPSDLRGAVNFHAA